MSNHAVRREVLRRNARAVTAMRRAFQEHRFGLILGAGVSKAFSFKVPEWGELLDRIASHPKVEAAKVDTPNSAAGTRADLLFRHFNARVRSELAATGPVDEYAADRIARGEWRGLIREILYESAPEPPELAAGHSYLSDYLEIVLRSPLTITYNFDSYLEMMLAARPSAVDERGRPYETVFDGAKPFRSTSGVIYHPNGYLPQNVLERASDDLVLSEEQFGDQLLASMSGQYSSLTHHLSKNTCLFIGLSLSDENLRHLLRRNAVTNPGHSHYYIHWVSPAAPLAKERAEALFDYRFRVYNLITLFLTNDEISALGQVLQLSYDQFKPLADSVAVPTKYVFYLTGVPGIGKTTLLRHLASLSIYDEWLSDPLPLLAKPHSDLNAAEKASIDDWVAKQMRDKNEAIGREREGIFVVERGPLDPVSFVAPTKIQEKAAWYRARVVPTTYDRLSSGAVIALFGDTNKVSARVASRQTIRQPPDYLRELQERLLHTIYIGDGVQQMMSTDWSIPQMVREVAEHIHLGVYRPANLQEQLEKLSVTPAGA